MILVDANLILRAVTRGDSPRVQEMNRIAGELLERVERGEEEIATIEGVLHEVAYVLTSKAHYQRPVPEVANILRVLLRLPGFHLLRGSKRVFLRALELWEQHPQLDLVDLVVAATALSENVPLATFDTHFNRIPEIARWQPPGNP